MSEPHYLLRLPASGGMEAVPVSGSIPPDTLAALLQTDVTERMRVPVMPEGLSADSVLCYFIDARGGDKALPANFPGTCFYHTGCPVCGDLLLALCDADSDSAAVSGLTAAQAALLTDWLHEQFPAYFSE